MKNGFSALIKASLVIPYLECMQTIIAIFRKTTTHVGKDSYTFT